MRTHDEFLAGGLHPRPRQDVLWLGQVDSARPDSDRRTCRRTREAPAQAGWKIALIGERDKDGRWRAPAHDAEVVWRGKGDLDLALLHLINKKRLGPKLKPEFASYKLVGPIGEIVAAGFPDAWASDTEPTSDYSVWGGLRIASQRGPYAWTVLGADKPDKPQGWKGMSGSAVCRLGPDDKVHLFGVVQEVRANFSEGLLEVARVSDGFEDADFRSHLQTALGGVPPVSAFQLPATADPTLRHLMTPNLRTMLLCRIHIDMRPVHDRSRGNLPPIPSPDECVPQ